MGEKISQILFKKTKNLFMLVANSWMEPVEELWDSEAPVSSPQNCLQILNKSTRQIIRCQRHLMQFQSSVQCSQYRILLKAEEVIPVIRENQLKQFLRILMQ